MFVAPAIFLSGSTFKKVLSEITDIAIRDWPRLHLKPVISLKNHVRTPMCSIFHIMHQVGTKLSMRLFYVQGSVISSTQHKLQEATQLVHI
jgi:hypothetical protein